MAVEVPIMISPPASLYMTVMTAMSVISLANGGLSEIRGKNVNYSKFWNTNNNNNQQLMLIGMPSRIGMVMAYTPAFLASLASFWIFRDEYGFRFLLLRSALTIHFFKRLFEVVLIHKYSGKMARDDAITISVTYLISTLNMIYAQHLTQGLQEPALDLKYLGIVVFLVGIIGNFYHHYILSNLRKNDGDKDYRIPKGGLFGLVICPHYLFEILGFIGLSFISQTLYTYSFTLGIVFYLMGRSYATRKWYLSKFEDFPKNVKAIFPFVF